MNTCRVCSKPIIDGDATYMGQEHWDCHTSQKSSNIDAIVNGVKTLAEARDLIRQLLSKGPFG